MEELKARRSVQFLDLDVITQSTAHTYPVSVSNNNNQPSQSMLYAACHTFLH